VEVLEIAQRDDFANVTGVGRAKGILPMMNHRDDVRLMGLDLANGIARTRVGQVDAEVLYIVQGVVGFANVTILRNMMNYPLVDFRLARDSIQTRMRQVDALRLANVTVLRNMTNHHLNGFRLAREDIQTRMRQVDALRRVGFANVTVLRNKMIYVLRKMTIYVLR
jgi:hypothetical protein